MLIQHNCGRGGGGYTMSVMYSSLVRQALCYPERDRQSARLLQLKPGQRRDRRRRALSGSIHCVDEPACIGWHKFRPTRDQPWPLDLFAAGYFSTGPSNMYRTGVKGAERRTSEFPGQCCGDNMHGVVEETASLGDLMVDILVISVIYYSC